MIQIYPLQHNPYYGQIFSIYSGFAKETYPDIAFNVAKITFQINDITDENIKRVNYWDEVKKV